jgi:signal transduction histidine kinase
MSEEVRDREREHFQHLLNYNRLLASAVSHEIRNLCAATIVAASNLSSRHELRGAPDLEALVHLVRGLKELASLELASTRAGLEHATDVASVIDQLRVVVEPDWDEIGGCVKWEVPAVVPKVAADAHGLLQIFLNLCQNSLRAVSRGGRPWLTVSVQAQGEDVVVTVTDAGPGIANPDRLFQLHPPESASEGSGLGLYISRALARSFGGELTYVPQDEGARFQVVIPTAGDSASRQRGVA